MAVTRNISQALVAQLVAKNAQDGGLGNDLVETYATVMECTARHVRRLVAEHGAQKPPNGYRVSADAFDEYFARQGDAAKAHKALAARGQMPVGLRQFQRAVRRDIALAERQFARHGEKAYRKHGVYVAWEAPHRNAIWMVDAKQLDVLTIPRRGFKPMRCWMVSFLDARTRACMGFVVTPEPTAEDVIAALRASVVLTPALGPFHGVCVRLQFDNALAHLATRVTQSAVALGILPTPLPPYSPHLNGKIERFHRTLRDEFAAALPFYTHAPTKADKTLFHPDGEPITIDLLVEKLFEFIAHYNRRRPHGALGGRTPEQVWSDDATPIRTADPEVVRLLEIPSKPCFVRAKGIEFKRGHYMAPELTSLHGEEVVVRFLPHDLSLVEVFLNGEWLCTAKRTEYITPSAAGAIASQRKREHAKAEAAMQRRVMRDQLELDRLKSSEDVREQAGGAAAMQKPSPLAVEPTAGSRRKTGAEPSRVASSSDVLAAFGLRDELHERVRAARKERTDRG